MDDLIKALTILNKYLEGYEKERPISCEHDVMFVQVDYTKISQDDIIELETLGFRPCEDLGNMMSFRYGSC
jgi:hypothetical protein